LSFSDFIARLEGALIRPLPGTKAHLLMAPRPRRAWPPGTDPARIRQAAGLLLLFPIADRPHVVLTVRSHTLDRHGGQVSLPGGVIEPDESYPQAALREAHEEVGLVVESVRTLGALTPLDIAVSSFRLHPIVAASDQRPALTPSDGEVARIIEAPVDELTQPRRVVWRTMTRDDRSLEVPAFLTQGVEIWGATAMVIAEFLALLGWKGPR
jgi:8-oxo-dGTP pyrophosphatase MutT (NUDIX family)